MRRLIKIELYKLIHRKSFLISLVISCIAIIAFGMFLKNDITSDESDPSTSAEEKQLQEKYENADDWKEQMQIQMDLNIYMSDIYGKEQVEVKNEILQYKIDHNLQPYEENTTYDFVAYMFRILGFLLSVFVIIIAVEIVISEYSNKTVKLIFCKPYKREEIIMSKYMAVLLYIIGLTIISFTISFIAGGILFTWNGCNVKTAIRLFHSMCQCSLLGQAIIYSAFSFVNMFIMGTIAFFLSVLFRSQVSALIVSLGILLFGNTVAEKIYSADLRGIKYSILANLNPGKFVDSPVHQGYTPFMMAAVIMIHMVLLIGGTIFAIKKSDF